MPQYFAFSPGIPWKLNNLKQIVPKMNGALWEQCTEGKQRVVLANGGLIETFFSTSLIEALARLDPTRPVFWAGNPIFKDVIQMNGMAKVIDAPLDLRDKYPIPLFFDKENFAYFNCMNNYLIKRSVFPGMIDPEKHRELIFKQMFNNLMIKWKPEYLPKLNIIDNSAFEEWCKKVGLFAGQKFILIIPEKNPGWSMHKRDMLYWKPQRVREFVAIMQKFKIPIVICTNNDAQYINTKAIRAPFNLKILIPLVKHCSTILSSDVDFLFLALRISKANIFSVKTGMGLNLYRHAELFGSENVINVIKGLSPTDVYEGGV